MTKFNQTSNDCRIHNKSVNLLDNFILHLLKKVINLSFIHMDQWYIRAINRLIINYDSSTFLFQNKIYKAKTNVDSICTYIYLYTYLCLLFVCTKSRKLTFVCVPARIRQSAMQSIYGITTIDSCVLTMIPYLQRERGRIRKGNCKCKL